MRKETTQHKAERTTRIGERDRGSRPDTPRQHRRRAGPMISTTTLHKLPVYNHDGQHLGSLRDLMIETDRGQVAYAVLQFEGDKCFALPFSMLNIDTDAERIYVDIQEEVFRQGRGMREPPP